MDKRKKKIQKRCEFDFDLPIEIIQHIQSFLDGNEAAKSGLLSKSWYSAWSTRPILDLKKLGDFNDESKDDAIRKSIRRTMKRYKKLNLKLEKLVIHTRRQDDASRYSKLIRDASRLGVNELHVTGISNGYGQSPLVPARVYAMRHLTKLSLCRCMIGELINYRVRLSRLVSLCLDDVTISKHAMQDLLSHCPLIENLDIKVLCGHAEISSKPVIDGGLVNSVPEFHKLRYVHLGCVVIDKEFFCKFSSRFPCVENLTIEYCREYGSSISISSQSLKYIRLCEGTRLHKLELDVPNVRKFVCKLSNIPALSFHTTSREWESEVVLDESELILEDREMDLYAYVGPGIVDDDWFLSLREFLMELSLSKISLDLYIDEEQVISVAYLTGSPNIPLVENLTVSYHPQASSLLSALFGCCHPKCITLNCMDTKSISQTIVLMQHLDEVFVQQKNAARCLGMLQGLFIYHHIEKIDCQIFEEMEWRTIILKEFFQHIAIERFPPYKYRDLKLVIRFRIKWGASNGASYISELLNGN